MLLRVQGGAKGIAQYLKTGRKKGRKQTRDELDERVVLVGDLAAMDTAISVLAKGKEKYLHLTLSFKEAFVEPAVLKEIAKKFEAFIRSAYREDELMVYAEAHLPRMKSLEVEGPEKNVERFTHIHIVIAKINLLTGKSADPLGRVSRQIEYLNAFQEWVNDTYGLASPKDNRRTGFQSGSDMVARHNANDQFAGPNRELKQKILQAILERNISSIAELTEVLRAMGEVRVRNAGTNFAYLNLKPTGDAKGVNLREVLFTEGFLQLSLQKKKLQLTASTGESDFLDAGKPRSPDPEHLRLLDEWRELRSKEIKYLNSGNKSQWGAYQEMNREDRLNFIEGLEREFYSRIQAADLPSDQATLDISGAPEAEAVVQQQFLNVSDSTLGQRIQDIVDAHLDCVYRDRVTDVPVPESFDAVLSLLAEKYNVPTAKFAKPIAAACERGTAGIYVLLRQTMNLSPNISWLSLVKLELVQPQGKFARAENTVSDLLLEEYRRRKAELEERKDSEQRRQAMALLQMSLVLSRKFLWSQHQLRCDQEQRRREPEVEALVNYISGPEESPKSYEPSQVFRLADWDHQTNAKGQSEFLRRKQTVIRDEDVKVVLTVVDVQVVEIALRLAVIKYGPVITIHGDEGFKRLVVEVASGLKLKVGFTNPELQRGLEARRLERQDGLGR